MAQWKETLEPYIKVNERIRTTTIVPTAGEDLIIGATIISDSGPSYPVLITSQREFLNVFASQDITKKYIESLNEFYEDPDNESPDKLASTMWLNAYRLAGSTNMLIVRATKGADMNYVVSLKDGDQSKYIVRDGQLLKQVNPGTGFSLTIDRLGNNAASRLETGWAISINEIGIIGNLVGDDGPVYEYFAADLRELVEYLNGTSKFFCPNPVYYVHKNGAWEKAGANEKPDSVYFKEVYLAQHFIDVEGFNRFYVENPSGLGTGTEGSAGDDYGTKSDGLAYLLATSGKESTVSDNIVNSSDIIDLNGVSYSDAEGSYPDDGYLVNTFNSNSELKIRIRRFNHDAVILRDDIKPTVSPNGDSPFEVITDVVDQYIRTMSTDSTGEATKRIEERDFYEVAVLDPSLDKDPLSFCVGNIPGRGDLTLDELNDTLKMINIHISSMEDLHLNYFGASISGEEGEEDPSLPENLPAAPKGFSWRELTDSSDYNGQLGAGAVRVIDREGGLVIDNIGFNDLNTIFTTLGPTNSPRTVYAPVVVDTGESDVVEVQVNNVVKITGPTLPGGGEGLVSYYRVASDGDGYKLESTTIPGGISITRNSILKIGSNYYKQQGSSFGGDINLLLISPTIDPVVLDSDEDLTIVNVDGEGNPEPIDTSSIASITRTLSNGTEMLTDGAAAILNDNLDSDAEITNDPSQAYALSGVTGGEHYYVLVVSGESEIYKDLSIKTGESDILKVTPDDLMRSISSITEDEVYTTEGLTDLGNTNIKFQTYLCNMAKNENYFYPISTLFSTNYLAIANYRTRLAQDSHKLYTSAPWDIDSGTVGFKFNACPSVIYWEAVAKNRSMNREFASVFGFSGNGQVLYTNPVTEFTKKQRQLLLSKQVNTVMWNTQSQTWNMNDCYTMTTENHILNEDGNSRLFIRINKSIPVLLKSLIGRKLGPATYSDAEDILKYWFERTIVPMQYSVSGYKITISTLEANDDQARRQNKMYVLVECLFPRSLKYVIVYSDALDMGMEFVGEIV